MVKTSLLEFLSWVKSTMADQDSVLLITALASFVTAFATLLLVLEMKRQRSATSKPVLKILPKYITAKLKTGRWIWPETGGEGIVNLKFVNFGAGPALNVKVLWNFDYEALIKALKLFDPYGQKDFKFESPALYLDNSIHNIRNQTAARFDAVPANKISEPDLLQVPYFFIQGFEKYSELGIIERPQSKAQPPSVELPDFPEIFAEVEYQEINGAKLKQRFKMRISPIVIRSEKGTEKGEGEIAVSIEIEEVKVIKKPPQDSLSFEHY